MAARTSVPNWKRKHNEITVYRNFYKTVWKELLASEERSGACGCGIQYYIS